MQSLGAAWLAQDQEAEHFGQRMLIPPQKALERGVLARGISVECALCHERVHIMYRILAGRADVGRLIADVNASEKPLREQFPALRGVFFELDFGA